ncbi:MAG: hypothetical protein KY429_12380 [Actinobacteria bacterium]|nr:hypothetical protein [Actinomycetota bacterium]
MMRWAALFRTPVGVGVGALIIATLAALRLLVVFDMDPTVFTAFGDETTATTQYGEEKLGREVLTRPPLGHDGKFFFVQANDPWLLNPEENAEILDRPIYRSQRMLYPVLAGGFGIFPARIIVWALPVVNVMMFAVGSGFLAAISLKHGGPAWAGYAFTLNIGLLSELFIDGAGILAFALACVGAWALEEERTPLAAMAFAGAALTREVMAVFIAAVAVFWLIRRRVIPWAVSLPAAIAILAWASYLRLRIDVDPGVDQVRELTLIPFSGLIQALTSGMAVFSDYLIIAVFLLLLFTVPYRAWRSRVYFSWGAVGFAALAPFLTEFVWLKSFDISRALAPLFTVFLLEFLLGRARREHAAIALKPSGITPKTEAATAPSRSDVGGSS